MFGKAVTSRWETRGEMDVSGSRPLHQVKHTALFGLHLPLAHVNTQNRSKSVKQLQRNFAFIYFGILRCFGITLWKAKIF